MKTLLLLPLFLTFCCQILEAEVVDRNGIPYKDGQLFYEKIVDVDSMPKNHLFRAAKFAIAKVFLSANSVMQNADEDGGVVIAKGSYSFSYFVGPVKVPARASFTLELRVKDNRYRMQMMGFELRAGEGAGTVVNIHDVHDAYDREKRWAEDFLTNMNAGAKGIMRAIVDEIKNYSSKSSDDF